MHRYTCTNMVAIWFLAQWITVNTEISSVLCNSTLQRKLGVARTRLQAFRSLLNVTTPGPELHKRDPDGLVQSLSPDNVRMLTHFLPEVRVLLVLNACISEQMWLLCSKCPQQVSTTSVHKYRSLAQEHRDRVVLDVDNSWPRFEGSGVLLVQRDALRVLWGHALYSGFEQPSTSRRDVL